MGKYDDALPHLNNAIEGLTNTDIPVGLYDYNQTFAPGGSFLPLGFTGPNYPFLDQNNENLYAKQAINPGAVSNNEIVIDQKTKGLFTDDDLRLNFFSSTAFFGPPYAGGLLRRAGPGTFLFGVLLPEIYLLRAECEARTNDLAAARMDVETLRSKRMPAASVPVPADTASQQMPLLRFIIAERTREFAVTGFRWFDMRRLSVDPLFSAATYTHTRYLADGTQAATYTLRPGRFVLRFAQKVIDQNPGMENNP
jgi:hypothetical protein